MSEETAVDPTLEQLYEAALEDPAAGAALADYLEEHGADPATAGLARSGKATDAVRAFHGHLFGYWSESASRHGHAVYRGAGGGEVAITAVYTLPGTARRKYLWPDKRFVGLVTECIGIVRSSSSLPIYSHQSGIAGGIW